MPLTRNSRMTAFVEPNRLNRQRSGSQTTLDDRRQTYGGMRRSISSANLRTPRHASRSPGIRTPSGATSVTSNSEQNRRMAVENTAKVMELIQSFRTFFKSLNLGHGGLKAMTINQFIDIISILMVKIGGKPTISKIRSNHEDVIINFLENVKYPYVVNKSCLKTPNSHGSYPEVIAILAFLCDLVRDIKKCQNIEMPLTPCDKLMNTEFMTLLNDEVRRNYHDRYVTKDQAPPEIDENPLDEKGEIILVDGYIAAKMKMPALTVDKLMVKTEKLKLSSIELERNLIESECEKYFNGIEERLIKKEREYVKVQDILSEKRKCLKMITMTHDEKAQKLAFEQAELKNLMQQIDHQKYSTIDIKQLMAKETMMKNSIAMIQNEMAAIQVEAADAQVKLARLQKLKLDAIRKFNEFTLNITKILVQSSTFQQINVNDYTIDPASSSETIENICHRLNQLNEKCTKIKRQNIEQIEQNKATLAEYKSQHNRLTQKYKEQMAEIQMANKRHDLLKQNSAYYETQGSEHTAKLKRLINEKITTKQRIDEEIAMLRSKINELEIKNAQLMDNGERKAYEIIQAKYSLCRQLDKLNDHLDDIKGGN